MTPDSLFLLANYAVLPAWLLLLVLPHHRLTQTLIHAAWIPLLLGPLYVWVLFFGPPAPEGAGFDSLTGVMALFTSPMAVLGGWVHYIIFDLFIGAWIVRDARRQQINHWLTVPILVITLMAGPAGLMLYLLLRAGMRKVVSLEESAQIA